MSEKPPTPEQPTQTLDQILDALKDQILVGEMNIIGVYDKTVRTYVNQLQDEIQRLNGLLGNGPVTNRTQRREQARAAKKSAKLKEKAEPKTTGHPKSIK